MRGKVGKRERTVVGRGTEINQSTLFTNSGREREGEKERERKKRKRERKRGRERERTEREKLAETKTSRKRVVHEMDG